MVIKPLSVSSAARLFIRQIGPHFDAQYEEAFAVPTVAEIAESESICRSPLGA